MLTTFNAKMVTEPKISQVNGVMKTTVRVYTTRKYKINGIEQHPRVYVTLVGFGKVAEALMMFSWKDFITVEGVAQWKEWGENGSGLFINLSQQEENGWPIGVTSRETHEGRWLRNVNKDGIVANVSLTAVYKPGAIDKYGRVMRRMLWWETTWVQNEKDEWEEKRTKHFTSVRSTKGTTKQLMSVKNGYRMLAQVRLETYKKEGKRPTKLSMTVVKVKKVETVKGQY